MELKSQNYIIKGMNQDIANNSFSNEFSIENKNIRITARDGNDFMNITNEKGTLLVDQIEEVFIPNKGYISYTYSTPIVNEFLIEQVPTQYTYSTPLVNEFSIEQI